MITAEVVDLHQEQYRHEQPEDALRLMYIISGEGYLRAQQRETLLATDDLVAVNPDLGYEVGAREQPIDYVLIRVAETTLDFSYCETDFTVLSCADCREQMRFFLREFFREQREKQTGWETAAESLLALVMVVLLRRSGVPLLSESNRSGKECSAVKRFIDANFAEEITLDILAERTGLNKYYLVHAFTRTYGISPINYLIRQRINGSQRLLRETDYNISKIALLSGFSSQSYFSQSFKRQTGMTPAQFRKQNQKE